MISDNSSAFECLLHIFLLQAQPGPDTCRCHTRSEIAALIVIQVLFRSQPMQLCCRRVDWPHQGIASHLKIGVFLGARQHAIVRAYFRTR